MELKHEQLVYEKQGSCFLHAIKFMREQYELDEDEELAAREN